ncbi:MAG: MBL fold metallo-hydrolase [Phycisphaerae bacterium]|nr:MBL fold metallo-hydrolase [Phycisphaerae bacterium]
MIGRVTVLVENSAGRRGLLSEHGLSFWVELGEKKILFDTGQGKVLRENAAVLGIPLERTDAVVLSHGHYDHTGGLADVLHRARGIPVYAHRAAFGPKYARNFDGTSRDIGMPFMDEEGIREHNELVFVDGPVEVMEGLRLTGPVPRETDFEDTGGAFYTDPRCTQPDELPDDQAAYLETPAGTFVLLGCAHAGVVNTLRYIRTLTDNRPIHTVIGGTHLVNAGPERMDRTVEELRTLDVRRLLPCHCTGFQAASRLLNEFPAQYMVCPTGTILEIDK